MGSLSRYLATFALLAALAMPAGAEDTAVLWTAGPTISGSLHAGVLLSDSQLMLFRRNGSVLTTIDITQSGDLGTTLAPAVSVATGLGSNLPTMLSTVYLPASNVFVVAGEGATATTPFARGANYSWTLPTVTGLSGTGPVGHSVTVSGNTIIALVQTSAGGFLCRSTNAGTTFACSTPGGFGAVATMTTEGATGTAQGLAALPSQIWLALDNTNTIWRSRDDGATWASVLQLNANAATVNAVACLTGTTCLASVVDASPADTEIWRTTDRGLTWTKVFDIPRGDRLTNLVNVGQGVVAVVGDPYQSAAPFGYRSADFGVSWLSIPPLGFPVPLAGANYVSYTGTFVSSTGSTVLLATYCEVATCQAQAIRSPLNSGPSSPPNTINQGAAASLANAWPVYVKNASAATPLADVSVTGTATLIRTARTNRIGLTCVNRDASVTIRVGDSTVTATSGVAVFPRATFIVVGTYAVYGISEGANVSVACTEELLQ